MMNRNNTNCKHFINIEKFIFLKKCQKKGILLPQNDCKKIDFDLLLIQQKRILVKQLKEILEKYRNFKQNKWHQLNYEEKQKLIEERKREKRRFIRKTQWLWKKQKERRMQPISNYQTGYKKSKRSSKRNKRDRERYRKRKIYKQTQETNKEIEEKILNKSSITLTKSDYLLLNNGLNFVPTPNWTSRIEKEEWENFAYFERNIEWREYHKDKIDSNDNNLSQIKSKKLKLKKFNKPQNFTLTEETEAFVDMMKSKLRNTKYMVKQNFRKRNNLNTELQNSLTKLKNLTANRTIVICTSDKDGKIIIMDYNDYIRIIKKELEEYQKLPITKQNLERNLMKIKSAAEELVVKIYKQDLITENLMYLTTGIKRRKLSEKLQKYGGPSAKYFKNMNTGYVYPLLKTHKLKKDQLTLCSIDQIPIRLVQAVGNTYLSRITAFLEEVLQPISIRYCQSGINEYCKDSKSYTEKLKKWKKEKTNQNNKDYQLVAGDVKALYPSLSRDLIEKALHEALEKHSGWPKQGQDLLIKLCLHCLNNEIIQFKDKFYIQKKGLITGGNDSVSLANIGLHYIINRIPQIRTHTEFFTRYIDDIMYITIDDDKNNIIQDTLLEKFGEEGLELTFRIISTKEENKQLEFLDILHCTNKKEEFGFIIKNYIKPTAEKATFINGKSFHPSHVFRGIIIGEAKRMKRLNEREEDYQTSIKLLEKKCKQSGFNQKIINTTIKKIKEKKNKVTDNTDTTPITIRKTNNEGRKITWSTKFKSLLRLSKKEKELSPNSQIVYTRPPTIKSQLTNYKKIAQEEPESKFGVSRPCKKCALCGNHGKYGKPQNMVKEIKCLRTMAGKTFLLKQTLDCSNYGIYAAMCLQCNELYIGQTVNSFSKRWTQHRKIWNNNATNQNQTNQSNKDENALFKHYLQYHTTLTKTNLQLHEAFTIIFLEQPKKADLDTTESFWIGTTNAKINIAKTCLPKIK